MAEAPIIAAARHWFVSRVRSGLTLDPAGSLALPSPAAQGTSQPQRNTAGWLSFGISVAVLLAAFWQLRALDPKAVLAMLPRTPLFWLVFLADYLLTPACDYLIFRRLWRVPPEAFAMLVRKMVSNQLLASYVGEAQFYAWARSHTAMVAAPFAAIKDVAIMSALAGNAATFGLLVIALPVLKSAAILPDLRVLLLPLAAMLLGSSTILLLRNTFFSLDRTDLGRVAAIHAARVVFHILLVALAWHLALPRQTIGMWLILSAMAMLVSRLPFVPNSGLVLAGLASVLIGRDGETTRLLAMMAGLTITTHIVIGLPLFVRALVKIERGQT